jgi:hypothetical protein
VINILTENVTDCIGRGSARAQAAGGMLVPGLSFADHFGAGSFADNGLQKETDQVVKYGGKQTA